MWFSRLWRYRRKGPGRLTQRGRPAAPAAPAVPASSAAHPAGGRRGRRVAGHRGRGQPTSNLLPLALIGVVLLLVIGGRHHLPDPPPPGLSPHERAGRAGMSAGRAIVKVASIRLAPAARPAPRVGSDDHAEGALI